MQKGKFGLDMDVTHGSKLPGRCGRCKKDLIQGEEVVLPGSGHYYHASCYEELQAAKPAKPAKKRAAGRGKSAGSSGMYAQVPGGSSGSVTGHCTIDKATKRARPRPACSFFSL